MIHPITLVATVLLLLVGHAPAQGLILGWDSNGDTYAMDSITGQETLLTTSMPLYNNSGIARDGDRLVAIRGGICPGSASGYGHAVVEVDTVTGHLHQVGPCLLSTHARFEGLAEYQGMWYSFVHASFNSIYQLVSIDPSTGVVTEIVTGWQLILQKPRGLASDGRGRLYWGHGIHGGIGFVDLAVPTQMDVMGVGLAADEDVVALDFAPNGALHASVWQSTPSGSISRLYRVDVINGSSTLISPGLAACNSRQGMAFFPAVSLDIQGTSVHSAWVIDINLSGGRPGSTYFTFLTAHAGDFPHGPLFGVDPLPGEFQIELSLPLEPFHGSLDATGAAPYQLILPGQVGLDLHGVTFEYSGGQLISVSLPAAGSI